MRKIYILILGLFCLSAGAQDFSGLMKNSYMEIKWVDSEHFTYTLEEDEGQSYYIVDSKSWKPQRMFDNKAFADSLNKISQGGQIP